MNFDQRCVIVTGAGQGIGQASARLFAAHGATVLVCDIDGEAAEATASGIVDAGHAAEAVTADVTNHADVARLVGHAAQRYGRLDVMFNNAGGAVPKRLHTISNEVYRQTMALNLDSVFFGCQEALKVMRPQGRGIILATTSGAGMNGLVNFPVYGAAKAAVINLIRSVAVEYGPEGIRANVLSPGPMKTHGLTGFLSSLPGGVAGFESRLPLKRMGTSEDIAQAAVFLASDAASYINGALLPVDGGIHATFAAPDPLEGLHAGQDRTG